MRHVRLTEERQKEPKEHEIWHYSHKVSYQDVNVWITIRPNGDTKRISLPTRHRPPKPYYIGDKRYD